MHDTRQVYCCGPQVTVHLGLNYEAQEAQRIVPVAKGIPESYDVFQRKKGKKKKKHRNLTWQDSCGRMHMTSNMTGYSISWNIASNAAHKSSILITMLTTSGTAPWPSPSLFCLPLWIREVIESSRPASRKLDYGSRGNVYSVSSDIQCDARRTKT